MTIPAVSSGDAATSQLGAQLAADGSIVGKEWYWWFYGHGIYQVIALVSSVFIMFHQCPLFSTIPFVNVLL